jgi:hypothetical protein
MNNRVQPQTSSSIFKTGPEPVHFVGGKPQTPQSVATKTGGLVGTILVRDTGAEKASEKP